MSSFVRSCCASAAIAAAVSMTVTVISPAGQGLAQQTVKARYQSVSIPLVALAGFDTAIPVTSLAAQLAVGAPDSSVGASPAAAIRANATNSVNDFIKAAVVVAALAANVLWVAAFPITFPIGFIWGQIAYPPSGISLIGLMGLPMFLAWQYVESLPASARSAADRSGVSGRAARSAAIVIKTVAAPALHDSRANQASGNPAAATKRAPRSAAAEKGSKATTTKAASAASKRRSAN